MADDLDLLTSALRETSADGEDGAATRLRVRRSLEANHRGRRQLVSFATATSILFAGTMSWAFATGRAAAVWRAIVDPVSVEAPAPAQPARPTQPTQPTQPVSRSRSQVAPSVPPAVIEPAQPSEVATPEPPTPVEAPTSEPGPVPARALAAAPSRERPARTTAAPGRVAAAPAAAPAAARTFEALYREAHERHFRGGDHAAAIAAWDAYLAAEPGGRFVAEARYNRALLLIRVGRYAEARAALAPYARGEIAGGYRRAEASRLLERLPLND